MISAEARAVGINKKQNHTINHPALKSGVFSKLITPVPPNTTADRHGSLSRRNRKTGALLQSKSSQILLKSSSATTYKNVGLEVKPEQIIWKGWEPGEEYTRNLTLKNVQVKTQKIKYKVPTSHFFSTLFPQVIVLSAGTSFTLPITFRPLNKEKYEDKIEFITNHGSFSISLQAQLPETKLHLPESIHFGLSPVHDIMELTFEMKNLSNELATKYSWEVPEPFSIIPLTGTLPARASCLLKVVFQAPSARVFEGKVICNYGDNQKKIMRLTAIGKYSHLLVSTSSQPNKDETNILHFGDVVVHKFVEKIVYLHNLSNVKAPFKFSRTVPTAWMDQAFDCVLTEGIVPPLGKLKIPIKFKPHVVGQRSIDYFGVSAIGNISKSTLKCIGACKGPSINLSANTVNFGVVAPGNSSSRSIQISNLSESEAVVQILLEVDSGVFRVNQNSFLLRPNGEDITLMFDFKPPYPINYHRRVTVLIYEANPMFIDFIGTCHSEETQPHRLKTEHLQRFKTHVMRGLSFYSPDILNNQYKEGKLIMDGNGCYLLPTKHDDAETAKQLEMAEFFDDGHHTEISHNPPHVSLDKMSVWIGEINYSQQTTHVTLQLTNHTMGKVTAMWIQDPTFIFEVQPHTCDIPPMKTTDFRVIFKPNAPNQFFGRELECYVFYKCTRDFRLGNGKTLTPPWLLTVDVSAHTFNGKNETFYPDVVLHKDHLTFPAVTENESSYRTVLLENKGTSPVLYQFIQECAENFTVKSACGLIRSKYHISAVRLIPQGVKACETVLTLRLNDNSKHDKELHVVGTGEKTDLLLSNSGQLFFRPTCVGTSNKRQYEIQNVCRLPIKFKWYLSHNESQCLSVEPREGIIEPNEIQEHTWTFLPREAKKYVFRPTALTWSHLPDQTEYKSSEAQKFSVHAIGEGTEGEIKAECCNIDFGCVISGSSKSEPLVLYNDSQCDLHYRITAEQFINSQYGEDPDDSEPMCLHLSSWEGLISARSKIKIETVAKPLRRVLYTWSLSYELLTFDGASIQPNSKFLLCELSAEGVYPTMAVIDARSSGSGANVSKTQLWRWFSLEHLNSCLDSDPEKAELMYSVTTRHSTTRRPSVYTKSIMDFNFGAASIDSEPCYVSVMIKNTGSVATQWVFLFPKDLELEVGYWAETGQFDEDELHELHIQDNKLFTVLPKGGNLEPGESKTILLTYKHDIPGTHRLPVLLKVEHGKEILLNFIGVTVESNRRYLHFPAVQHTFTPVPVGGPTPPKQLYEMYNGGNVAVAYEIDMAPLDELRLANFDHPILTCLNPRGEILPGTSSNLEWIFSPLETKNYSLDIPIHIMGGETALITFKGIGYDKRNMGSTLPMLDQPVEYTSVPSDQKVHVPGQIVFLSEERVSFGNVPLFGRSRHIIFLQNKSTDRPISYSWHAATDVVNEVLRIDPIQGYLEPGQNIMTKVTFCAAGQPSFYDLDLICEVVDEIKMAEYQDELDAWDEERARQDVEFVITDDDSDCESLVSMDFHAGPSRFEMKTSPRRNLENVINKPPSQLKLTKSQMSSHNSKTEKKSYQTLPPIRFEDPVKFPSNRSRMLRQQERVDKNIWPQPILPKPFISHLGVTARTHDIAEFRTNFPKESGKHFIDRTLQVKYPASVKSPRQQYSLTLCDQNEKDLVVDVMSNLFRGLLDDPTFHEKVAELGREPTPYFPQLAKEEELIEKEEEEMRRRESERNEREGEHGQTESVSHEVLEENFSQTSNKLINQILKQGSEQSRPSSGGSRFSDNRREPSLAQISVTQQRVLDQEIKRSSDFNSLLEDVLSTTISNIMEEAMRGDVILTARPRVVALPPSRGNANPTRSSKKNRLVNSRPVSSNAKHPRSRATNSSANSCASK